MDNAKTVFALISDWIDACNRCGKWFAGYGCTRCGSCQICGCCPCGKPGCEDNHI